MMEFGLVIVWFAAYAVLGALALPTAAALFPRFPGKGAGFALPLSLATLTMTSYYVGRIAFGWESLFVGLLVLVVASVVALRRGVEVDRRAYVESLAVFGAGFLLFVGVRAIDPAVHPGGGEKFLDFGLLNSLWRSPTVPPEDMWYAGEPMAYYYGGHMLAALLAKFTGTPPRFAYNLALPGFYGLLVVAAYTLAGAVASDHGANRVSAGALAAVLAGAASNLVTPLRALAWVGSETIPGLAAGIRALGVETDGLADGPEHFSYWSASRVIDGTINEFPFFAFINGDMHAHMMSLGFLLLTAGLLFSYWQAPPGDRWRRRGILLGCVPVLAGMMAITNTWTFPTVAGLAWIAVLFAPARPRTLVPFADRLFGDGSGADPASDGVDSPTGPGGESSDGGDDDREKPGGSGEDGPDDSAEVSIDLPFDPGEEVERIVAAVAVAAFVGVAGYLLVYPFFATSASDRSIALVENHSGLLELLIVHGAFLAVTVPYLAVHADPGEWDDRVKAGALVVLVAAITVVVSFLPVGAALFAPLLLVAWVLLRADRDVDYETALFVGAFGLLVLVELVYVTRAGRYNTVFKYYEEVWVLWATAVGVALARHADPLGTAFAAVMALLRRGGTALAGSERPATDGGRGGDDRSTTDRALSVPGGGDAPDPRRLVAAGLAAVLVASTLLYPALAVAEHVEIHDEPATLDATRFVEEDHSREAGAIEWLRNDVSGQPNMVSIPTKCMYRWSTDGAIRRAPAGPTPGGTPCDEYRVVGGSAPASLTGVPTVAGWYHETGYRGDEPFLRRVRDVRTIYNGTPEERVEMLRKYDVELIYVGPAERYRWGEVTFDELTGLEVAYSDDHVTIYRVDHSELGVADS